MRDSKWVAKKQKMMSLRLKLRTHTNFPTNHPWPFYNKYAYISHISTNYQKLRGPPMEIPLAISHIKIQIAYYRKTKMSTLL
jgi:hypothetical protein